MSDINLNQETYRRLKRAYQEAVDSKSETFKFQELVFYVPYAKYLLEYLAPKFEKPNEVDHESR